MTVLYCRGLPLSVDSRAACWTVPARSRPRVLMIDCAVVMGYGRIVEWNEGKSRSKRQSSSSHQLTVRLVASTAFLYQSTRPNNHISGCSTWQCTSTRLDAQRLRSSSCVCPLSTAYCMSLPFFPVLLVWVRVGA